MLTALSVGSNRTKPRQVTGATVRHVPLDTLRVKRRPHPANPGEHATRELPGAKDQRRTTHSARGARLEHSNRATTARSPAPTGRPALPARVAKTAVLRRMLIVRTAPTDGFSPTPNRCLRVPCGPAITASRANNTTRAPRRRTHTAGSARLVNSRRITTVSIGRLAMQVTIKTGAAPPKMRLVWYGKFCVVRFRIPPHP